MKTSLWIVIALVSGIVGFLTGYSVSSLSGAARLAAPGAPEAAVAAAAEGEAVPHARAAAPAERPSAAGGYGAGEEKRPAAAERAPEAKAKPVAAGY